MEYIRRSKEWESVAREAYKAQKRRKEYEEIEKKLIEKLKEISEGESSESKSFRFQKIERKGSILYKNIPQLKSIDLEKYRSDKSTSIWKLIRY